MSYVTEAIEAENEIVSSIGEEEFKSFLNLIKRPDGAREALAFQYENLDVLTPQTLEKYMGALSQYLIWITKYINELKSKRNKAESVYKKKLEEGFFKYSAELKQIKSMTEKEMIVKFHDQELVELQNHIDKMDASLTQYYNIPDTTNNLIQSIKKTYDSRIKERVI